MKTFFAVFFAIMAAVAVVGYYFHSEKEYAAWVGVLKSSAVNIKLSADEVFKDPTKKTAQNFEKEVGRYYDIIERSGVYRKDRYDSDAAVNSTVGFLRSQMEKNAPDIVQFLPAEKTVE